jgi:molecular chaperone GrpE (heat shock protein)
MGVSQSSQRSTSPSHSSNLARERDAAVAETQALRASRGELQKENEDLALKLKVVAGGALVSCVAIAAFTTGQRKKAVDLLTKTAQAQKARIAELQTEASDARRRAALEVEKANKFALQKFATDMLSVADNLERAKDSAPSGTSDASQAPMDIMHQGVVLT